MRQPGFIKRAPRVDTHIRATVADSEGETMPVVVTDISREGCKLETESTLTIGEQIEIQIDRYGSYSAKVRWAMSNEAGAVFLDSVVLP